MNNFLELLRTATNNPQADFHPGQLEAIESVLNPPFRSLVVQATGWGKSMVYFIATSVLRSQGRGPTIVISPLLSLMRNQEKAAANLGLTAESLQSENTELWLDIENRLRQNQVDLLLVSPERLANETFAQLVSSTQLSKAGLVVVDEAHCISDWGHDFRPDYQRIRRLIKILPPTTSVLATTATANERVINDITNQIGNDFQVIRGSLARQSLNIQVIKGMGLAERLAWLSDHLGSLPGSGIIYCLTKRDTDRVAEWLSRKGYAVKPYHSRLGSKGENNKIRIEREDELMSNSVKALVATSALGMGFDKPDLGFTVHFQSPGNLVALYQQIGRAGRAIESAISIMFVGSEDDEIHRFFIENAKPVQDHINEVVRVVDDSENGLSVNEIMTVLDYKKSYVDRILKNLMVLDHPPITKAGSKYVRNTNAYDGSGQRSLEIEKRRKCERDELLKFAETDACLMNYIRSHLDDLESSDCGTCSNCRGNDIVSTEVALKSLAEAQRFLNECEFEIPPRKQWVKDAFPIYGFKGSIPATLRCEIGLCLSAYGDPGIARWVKEDKPTLKFRDQLAKAAVEGLRRRGIARSIEWVTAVPSLRSGKMVANLAQEIATELGVPFVVSVSKILERPPQKSQQNSFHQSSNLDGAFKVSNTKAGTVLLVDDLVDSRWTFTVIGALLRQAGVKSVVPFALCSSTNADDDD